MLAQVIVSGLLYTVLAGILAAFLGVALKSQARQRESFSTEQFVAIAAALGALSALLYLQPFLTYRGYAIGWVDPAYYVGYFTIDPLIVISQAWGVSQFALAPVVCSVVASGFLAVLVVSAVISGRSAQHGLKIGVATGAEMGVIKAAEIDATWLANQVVEQLEKAITGK